MLRLLRCGGGVEGCSGEAVELLRVDRRLIGGGRDVDVLGSMAGTPQLPNSRMPNSKRQNAKR